MARRRAVLKIGQGCPSTMAILENAHGLARYAQLAQARPLPVPACAASSRWAGRDCAPLRGALLGAELSVPAPAVSDAVQGVPDCAHVLAGEWPRADRGARGAR